MKTLREAAQLALDALHLWHWTKQTTGLDAAHDALRDAILEPDHTEDHLEMVKPLTDAELAELSDMRLGSYDLCLEVEARLLAKHRRFLYMRTHPQRKPLTDEEIVKISDLRGGCYGTTDFARAIERAHGIGEKE